MATLDTDDLAAIANLIRTTVGLANVVEIDGLTTTNGAAILNLKRLVIANNTSDAAFSVTNSTGYGVKFAGGTSYEGLFVIGGTGGANGIAVIGGGGGSAGINVVGGTDGNGVSIVGTGGYSALQLFVYDAPGLEISAFNSNAIAVTSSGVGNRDVALLGSGTILGSIGIDLSQSLLDVKDATVGGALNGAHVTAWGKVVKDVSGKLLKLFTFGSSSTPKQTFTLDDGTNPTTRTPQ